ncbi:MAG: sigma-54-dependent Fis family transcriptional regulator [candidate division Zixibacteria bacterium]|nr:sigma-54-dependent Fis family transcriptional regulator [candidate division Zixibacteria bacterium]
MTFGIPQVLFFGEEEYDFLSSALDEGWLLRTSEASQLVEAVKQQPVPILIFDSSHSQFSESLVIRVYRKIPEAEFWLVGDLNGHYLSKFLVDAVLPFTITGREFGDKVNDCLKVRERLSNYNMVGKSANLKHNAEIISQVAPTDISTLIIGPSGAGKELVARAVHENSKRKNKPYIAVNCGAFAETLLESELFGYEKGAFTGAIGRREGIFKRADGGTVFLDEIGETPPSLQVRLLRVLEEGAFYRVGGGELVRSDVRIIAATNRELLDAIQDGEFREDLYFRLGAMRINLTGLADRKADIMPLINHFFRKETGQTRMVARNAMERLLNYGWPGNVRQLRNFVSRTTVIAGKGEISESHVMQFLEEQGFSDRSLPVVTGKSPQEAEFQLIYQALLSLGQEVRMLRDIIMDNLPARHETVVEEEVHHADSPMTMDGMEEQLILKTLESVGGNRREAARKLGIGERTLYRKLKKYGEL